MIKFNFSTTKELYTPNGKKFFHDPREFYEFLSKMNDEGQKIIFYGNDCGYCQFNENGGKIKIKFVETKFLGKKIYLKGFAYEYNNGLKIYETEIRDHYISSLGIIVFSHGLICSLYNFLGFIGKGISFRVPDDIITSG